MTNKHTTGRAGEATEGKGDVQTGRSATRLTQGLAPIDAARAGAYWHGLAAKKAGLQRAVGVIARDVADALGSAIPSEPAASELVRIF